MILVAAILICAVGFGFTSLRRPASVIESSLLRMAPLGSSKADVLRAIEKQGWKHSSIRPVGFLKQESSRPRETVGTISIEAHLGDYGIFLNTSVVAYWGFDANGKLIAVWVWKTTDAP
jgi:hypothetical protein